MKKINVMVVDDSAVVRQVLSNILNADPHINVSAVASDPIYAMEKMRSGKPDVIVLDIEMPRMDGITFLRKLMAEQPTPVVICSTLTEKGAVTTVQALEAGAISIVTKPKMGLKSFLEDSSNNIVATVKAASVANIANLRKTPIPVNSKKQANTQVPAANTFKLQKTTDSIVAMGTSTGGTQALERILSELPRVSPGIVIVQHMPEKFTAAFSQRLNDICEIEVKEAATNDRVIPGRALVAPGGKHMTLVRSGAQYHVKISDGPPVNRHIPSVDVLFRSVAKIAGANALGIIMTGMGNDGASGLLEMRNEKANTIAQDEASSIVFGMPKEAINLGAAEKIISLSNISEAIMNWFIVKER